ncbi:competence type IV pilus minor pilin ComGF [Niallia taxi]|uniref:competence type IV pilus minor pilin ComGF n=1 Tax=Niallia taxi TaxID=2499688 RepID=UPI00317FF65E
MRGYRKKQPRFVKTYKGETGFILAEMLVALSLFLIICAFFPLTVKLITDGSSVSHSLRSLEWDVFIHQLKKEVRLATSVRVSEQKLNLTVEGENVQYEKYENKIRRRVNGAGHEVCLQEIEKVEFEAIESGVRILVTDTSWYKRNAAARSFLSLNEAGLK